MAEDLTIHPSDTGQLLTVGGIVALGLLVQCLQSSDFQWLVRRHLKFVPVAPPVYGKTEGQIVTDIDVSMLLPTVRSFFLKPKPAPGGRLCSLLSKRWWQIEEDDIAERKLTVSIEYVENVNSAYRTGNSSRIWRKPDYEEFRLVLTLVCKPWEYSKPPSHSAVISSWRVEGATRFKSVTARDIIDSTLTELNLSLNGRDPLAQRSAAGQSTPTGQTGLMSHFGSQVGKRSTAHERHFTKEPSHITSKRSAWPSPQEFNEALQNPQTAFVQPELKTCVPELDALGLPKAASGAFASVYRVRIGDRDWAIKCFLREVQDQEERYRAVSSFTAHDDLPSTVNFEFFKNGIRIRDRLYPMLRMEWVEGTSLPLYLDEHANDRTAVQRMAQEFLEMVSSLYAAGIAHGDLQHGNIIITGNGLCLVDYDGMFVPALAGHMSNELGHRNYQHPQRNESHFGPDLDNFSAWLIYLTLKMIERDPALWLTEGAGDECLLFRQLDLACPENSSMFATLCRHEDPEIRSYADLLIKLTRLQFHLIPRLQASLPDLVTMQADAQAGDGSHGQEIDAGSNTAVANSSSTIAETSNTDLVDETRKPNKPENQALPGVLPDWMT